MKLVLTTLIVIFISLSAHCQELDPNNPIDQGVKRFQIDKKPEDLKRVLSPIKTNELWGKLYSPDMITSVYEIKLKKAGIWWFHGKKIVHGEVQMDGYEDEETGKIVEDVFQFTFYFEKHANATEFYEWMMKLEESYGQSPGSDVDDETGINCPTWFTDVTSLTISGLGLTIKKNGKEYAWVTFYQAYGG